MVRTDRYPNELLNKYLVNKSLSSNEEVNDKTDCFNRRRKTLTSLRNYIKINEKENPNFMDEVASELNILWKKTYVPIGIHLPKDKLNECFPIISRRNGFSCLVPVGQIESLNILTNKLLSERDDTQEAEVK